MNANSLTDNHDLAEVEDLLATISGGCSASPGQAAIEAADRRRKLDELEAQRRTSGSTPELEQELRQMTFEYRHFISVAEGTPAPVATGLLLTPTPGAVKAANDEPAMLEGRKTIAETITRMQSSRYEAPEPACWEPFRASAHGMTDHQIIFRLKTLLAAMVGTKPDARDVIKSRAEEFGLHIALNERKTIAPAFRPYRRAEKPGNTHWIDPWIVGDRTVIDLHWYHTLGVLNPARELAPLLDGDFSFEKASVVPTYRMKLDTKANAAGISEVDQLLGTMFRTPRIRDRWLTIDRRLRALRRTLLDCSRIDRYRLDAAAIQELENVACALFIARGVPSVAAKIVVHVGGAPALAQKMRDHKKRLERFKCAPGGWGEDPGRDEEIKGMEAGEAFSPKTLIPSTT